jgi:hypothetical protein
MATKVEDAAIAVDRAMIGVRDSMKGLSNRFSGFKRTHDQLAKTVAQFTVTFIDAAPLIEPREEKRRRARR